MGEEASNNLALLSSGYDSTTPGNPFWKTQIPQPAKQLEYMLKEETFSINGEAYEGFTRIWNGSLGGRKQLHGGLPLQIPPLLTLLITQIRFRRGQDPSIFWYD